MLIVFVHHILCSQEARHKMLMQILISVLPDLVGLPGGLIRDINQVEVDQSKPNLTLNFFFKTSSF